MANIFFDTGDIVTGTGLLGTMVKLSNVTTDFSIVPGVDVVGLTKYYSTYNIETTTNNLNVTMPSAADVAVGWSCKFTIILNSNVATAGSIGTLNVRDDLGNLIYVFNTLQYINASYASTNLNSSATFILRDLTPTWAIEPDVSESVPTANVITYNTNYPLPRISGIMNSLRLNGELGVDINVAFAAPVIMPFVVDPTQLNYDTSVYTPTATTVTLLKSGMYSVSVNPGTNPSQADIQIAIRKNGVTVIPSYAKYSATSNLNTLRLKSLFPITAGEYIEVLIGRTAVGAATVTDVSTLMINYLGD